MTRVNASADSSTPNRCESPVYGEHAPTMQVIDLRGQDLSWAQLRAAVPRQTPQSLNQAEATVRAIIEDVQARGPAALREYAGRFDRVEQDRIKVDAAAIQDAVHQLDPAVRHGLESAIARCRAFAAAQRPADAEVEVAPGAKLVHRWTPVARVGLYVPGGLAVYPSSVVMNRTGGADGWRRRRPWCGSPRPWNRGGGRTDSAPLSPLHPLRQRRGL